MSDYMCPITAKCPITLSDYNYTEWLMKNKAANAPITFEEIVMVMINTNTGLSVHTQIKRNDKTKSVLDISQAKH